MLYKKLWLNLWVFAVTTFAVVWIEIFPSPLLSVCRHVTTFAVVWIEMPWVDSPRINDYASPPSRWCGLKYCSGCLFCPYLLSPPSRWCGLKLNPHTIFWNPILSPPSRWCGLKSPGILYNEDELMSPPSRWCGLKLLAYDFSTDYSSHHLRGGVD